MPRYFKLTKPEIAALQIRKEVHPSYKGQKSKKRSLSRYQDPRQRVHQEKRKPRNRNRNFKKLGKKTPLKLKGSSEYCQIDRDLRE
jgi:hypothetical protein